MKYNYNLNVIGNLFSKLMEHWQVNWFNKVLFYLFFRNETLRKGLNETCFSILETPSLYPSVSLSPSLSLSLSTHPNSFELKPAIKLTVNLYLLMRELNAKDRAEMTWPWLPKTAYKPEMRTSQKMRQSSLLKRMHNFHSPTPSPGIRGLRDNGAN